jgi:phosphoglucomutase
MSRAKVTVVETKVFSGQKPGTSGLRKKVEEFMQEHYMENFIQCTLEAMGPAMVGSTLVVGGDGRYGVDMATDKIIKMAAANGVRIRFLH